MEFKGTKGKWFICGCPFFMDGQNHGAFDIITEDRKEVITGVSAYDFWGQTFESAKANALLISKAPEMLEMLKDLLTAIRQDEFLHDTSIKQWFEYKSQEVEELIIEATEII